MKENHLLRAYSVLFSLIRRFSSFCLTIYLDYAKKTIQGYPRRLSYLKTSHVYHGKFDNVGVDVTDFGDTRKICDVFSEK